MTPDPFRHHPGLRDKIKPARESFFRDFRVETLIAMLEENGSPPFRVHDHATRQDLRRAALAEHEGDLWVFAYGSLIWDPALLFTEVRRAYAPEHARKFILEDTYGGRGTVEAPGLMAALDAGAGCHGLCYRIAQEAVETETEILFRREMLGPGYNAVFIPVEIEGTGARALSFVADLDSGLMHPDLPRETQIRYAATGRGFLGSSYEYLRGVVDHLHEMKIPDSELDALLADVEAEIARLPGGGH